MKKIVYSMVAVAALSSVVFAGGDFGKNVEPAVMIPVVMEPVPVDESGFYVGLGLSGTATTDGTPNIFDVKARQDRTGDVTLLAGYDFNQYMAVEARYMDSFTQEDVLERNSWGIYVKPQYPINEKFNVYALLGYGGMTADSITPDPVSVDDEGFQWGLGANYSLVEYVNNLSLFVDYVRIANDMDADVFLSTVDTTVNADTLTVGVTYKF